MALSAGKIALVIFEKTLEAFEAEPQLLPRVNFWEPNARDVQNASNVIWRPVQQHKARVSGWDVSAAKQGVIEETYPAVLGTPYNDPTTLRIDDVRDMNFWEKSAKEGGRTLARGVNTDIASAIATQGSLFIRSNATDGYDFIGEAQALMNERQAKNTMRTFVLNDRDNLAFASDLAARQTLQGRPEQTWVKGQIGQNIADFDIFTGAYLPNITGGADPAVTITGDQSFAPSGGSVDATTLVVTNVDYREASLVVNDSSLVSVGDKFTLENTGVAVQSMALGDKVATGQPMTFTVISKPDATHIKVYPKPIAYDDAALSTLEKSYANINTQILNAATLTRLNVDATKKANIFFDQTAVEVLGGSIPAGLLKEFEGMKVIEETMSNGLKMYMIYSANADTLYLTYRIFVWYGITVANPSNCGVAVRY